MNDVVPEKAEDKKVAPDNINYFIKEDLPKYFQSVSLVGITIGYSLLFWYCRTEEIPFPLDFGALPVLLLLTALAGILIIVYFSLIIFLPTVFSQILKSDQEANILEQVFSENRLKSITLYFQLYGSLTTWIHLLIFSFSIHKLNNQTFSIVANYFLILTAPILLGLFLWGNFNMHRKSKKKGMKAFLSVLSSNGFYAVLMMIWSIFIFQIVILLIQRTKLAQYGYEDFLPYFIVIVVSFVIISLGYLITWLGKEKKLKLATVIVCALFGLVCLFSPIPASFLGSSGLRALNIGSVSTCYQFKDSDIKNIFPEAIGQNNHSKVLVKVLSIGSQVYVKVGEDKSPFSIQKKYIASEYKPTNDDKGKPTICSMTSI